MNNLYLDLSVVSSVPDAYNADSKLLMRCAGANVGNYAFRHALNSILDLSLYKTISPLNINRELAIEKPQSVIVSCANWLRATEQSEHSNGNRVISFSKFDCEVVAFGLGAQASSDKAKLVLGPNTIKLARILADKCHSLSVRDAFTAETLSEIGVKNTIITGCPSNFINLDSSLGTKIIEKASIAQEISSWKGIRAHISEFSGGNKMSGAVLKATLELLGQSSSFYVIQSPALLPLLLREDDKVPPVYLANFPDRMKSVLDVSSFLKSKVLHFSSIESWMDFSRTCDISIGMRIHGNVVPLQAGVPSILIAHDSRTTGLSNIMGIPTMQPSQFIELVKSGPAKIYGLIANQMENYDTTRMKLAKIMAEYLVVNNINPSSQLTSFIH